MSMNAGELMAAQTAHREGRLAEAEKGYRRWVAAHPREANGLHFFGMLKFQTGRKEEGIDSVRRSLKVDDRNPHAWNNLGNMLASQDHPQDAIDAYKRAAELAPDLVQAWYNLGVCYRRTKQITESVMAYCKAVELQPADTVVYERFGMLLYGLGRFKEASDVYRQWLKQEPDSAMARHMLAAMTGADVPERADDQYLKNLFDNFSDHFDEQLASLGYRAPELLVSVLGEYVPNDGRLALLDAGCGTGLCAPLVRSLTRRLVGVDISEGMVAKARDRNLYDELVVEELVGFMHARPGAFDVVLSADTLVYFGALEDATAAAFGCLHQSGVLAFTLERLDEDAAGKGYNLQPHGRYAHYGDYVDRCLRQAGFSTVHRREVVLRKERGKDVQGYLLIALV